MNGDLVRVDILVSFLTAFGLFATAQANEGGRYVALHSGYGVAGARLSGTGFNADLPGRGALLLGAELSYQNLDNEVRYQLRYETLETTQGAPAGVTPTQLNVSREDLRFIVSFATWASQNVRLGLGYGFSQNGATDTLPNNVYTKLSTQGFLANIVHRKNINHGVLASELLLYLPHQIRESQQVTGYNPKYLGVEIKAVFEYSISEKLVASAGLRYRLDQVSYDGSATRGVTAGQDTRTMWAIPIGIRMEY